PASGTGRAGPYEGVWRVRANGGTRGDHGMRPLCVGLAIAVLVGAACGQEKKAATITITAPERGFKDTVVKVDGAEVKGSGGTWTFTTPALEPGKEYKFKVEALIEPNNYTKITRPREVTVKAGDAVKLDLTAEDKKLDKIGVRR